MSHKPSEPTPALPIDRSRRELLKGAIGLGLLATVADSANAGTSSKNEDKRDNPVALENAKPGTTDWMLSKTHIEPETKYRSPRI